MQKLPKIENSQTLVQAFEQLKTEHKQIKSFLFGNYYDLVAESRSNLQYPALLLELPNALFDDNGADHRSKTLSTAFIVLDTFTKNTSKTEKLQKMDLLCEIVEDIIARLYDESTKNYEWYFEVKGEAQMIDTVSQDNDCGYRYEFEIKRRLPIIQNLEKWN